LTGCATDRPIIKAIKEGMPENTESFIILKSSEKITGTKLVFPKNPGTPRSNNERFKGCWPSWNLWIKLDDTKYQKVDICAYQDAGEYHVFSGCETAMRIRFGRMNFYFFYQRDVSAGTYTYYAFDKNIDKCSPKRIKKDLHGFYEAIADNPAATKLCHEYFPDMKISQTDASLKKLLAIVDKYNE
jgi:hypothetical protein